MEEAERETPLGVQVNFFSEDVASHRSWFSLNLLFKHNDTQDWYTKIAFNISNDPK